jgi:hypothetical protein
MAARDERLIEVRGAWNAWRTAEVRIGSLLDVHWFQPAGAPRPMVHAYTFCSDIVTGDIPHDCGSTPGSHRLLVCVLKRSASPELYVDLVRRADASLKISHVAGLTGVARPFQAVRAS